MDENLLHDLVGAALKAGADAAEAVAAERQSLSVNVRLGDLEEVEREEARDLGIRVLIGRKQASVSGSDLSAEGRAKLVERVLNVARMAAEDPYAGLAPPDRLAHGPFPDLELYDPAEPSPEDLEARALAAEDAARAVKGVTNSDGGSAAWSTSRFHMVTSGGFSGEHRAWASRSTPRPSPATRPAWSGAATAARSAGRSTCPTPGRSAPRRAGARCSAWARARSTARPPR
jgi:PmbA protein